MTSGGKVCFKEKNMVGGLDVVHKVVCSCCIVCRLLSPGNTLRKSGANTSFTLLSFEDLLGD